MLKLTELTEAFRNIGIGAGDTLVVQSSFKGLMPIEGDPKSVIQTLLEVVGKNGTLIMPAYNLKSWTEGHYFDIKETPSTVGVLAETFRLTSGVRRTKHPIHSFSVYGKLQDQLCSLDEEHSFGESSVFTILLKQNAMYCSLGLGLEMPFLPCHYAEAVMKVPYRRRKDFSGIYVDENAKPQLKTYCFDVRENNKVPPTDKSHILCYEKGSVRKQAITDNVNIFYSTAQDYHQASMAILKDLPEVFS